VLSKYKKGSVVSKVIAVLNQKGGAGKTTIATHLARAFQLDGKSVILIDSDPQGSARDWSAAHEAQPISVVGIDRPTIERDLKSLAPSDYIVIDGAPQAADLAVSAIKAADFILMPVQPSPYDIWATADLVDLVKQRIQMTDGRLKAAFVISRAIANTKLGAEVGGALEGYGLPVLATRVYQRVSYPGTAATGKTVFDTEPNGDAAAEFRALKNEIEQLIK
jgi:chromosome partitioning protein